MSERADEPQDAVPPTSGQDWPPADSINDAPTQVAGYQPPRAPQADQHQAQQPTQPQQPQQYGYPQQGQAQQPQQPYQQFVPQQGYGYPQQSTVPQNPYQQPPQAYPYAQAQQPPQPQQAYASPQSSGPAEPDWGQLADRHESQQKRRRQLTLIGAAVGVLAVAGGVTAVVLSGGGGKPSGQSSPSPVVSASASHTAKPSPSPTPRATAVPADRGSVPLQLGTAAALGTQSGWAGKSLLLSGGAESYAASSGPLLDTRQSFTISLRVRADSGAGGMIALSQGAAGNGYAFSLGRVLSGKNYGWSVKLRDAKGVGVGLFSHGVAPTNQWVLLAVQFDAAHKNVSLYVNGVLQAQHKVTGMAAASGGVQLGRVRVNNRWVAAWRGEIADVRMWQRALSADDIGAVATGTDNTQNPAPYAWLTAH